MILFFALNFWACQPRAVHPADRLMALLDTDCFGSVDAEELVVAMPKQGIALYDLDESSDLDTEELDTAMRKWEAPGRSRRPSRPTQRREEVHE